MTEREADVAEELDLTPSPRLLEVLGDIPYQPWQCLAELIDNAFDEFNSDLDRDPSQPPMIHITVPKPSTERADAHVSVSDNGRGMSREKLQNALRAGFSGNSRYGSLGLFGMGFNIATARLGGRTEVRTTRAGDEHWLVAEINFKDLQRRETFFVPIRREPKSDPGEHGTVITVRDMKKNMFEALKRPATITKIKEDLGRVYSYLLRSQGPIPELPDGDALTGRGISLLINNKRVRPRTPCVWSASRSVAKYGTDISAVQIIDRKLTDAYACMDCGHWNRDADVDRCVECDSDRLELRQRRVHGWLGVQRYLDESDYGIDFLRHGRKIVRGDKSLFTWTNADDGESMLEYPIEVPANKGRLVGEIHLDHVQVDYQKTDFDRTTREWRDMVRHLRGEGPMREKKAKERNFGENDSPLGLLFRAYQTNSPGARSLIPGNGEKAIHEAAAEWGRKFHEGLPEYQTDEIWYAAVLTHEQRKAAKITGGDDAPPASDDLGGRTGLDPTGPQEPGERQDSEPPPPPEPPRPVETEEQRFARYRQHSRRLLDLEGDISVSNLGRRRVSVFETTIPVVDPAGDAVPVVSRATAGIGLEVYVHGEHEVFREFGRDPRDYAIMEMAHVLRALGRGNDAKLTVIAAEITRQFPDQRVTDSALRERAEACLRRIRELAAPVIVANAADMWGSLPPGEKLAAEKEAARSDARLDWLAATKDGSFGVHLGYEGFAALVRSHPRMLMDGAVFDIAWASWTNDQAREQRVHEVTRLLETIGGFLSDTGYKDRQTLAMARLVIDSMEGAVAQLNE